MIDLFSGIGGFPLAAQWVWGDELEIVGFCEIDPHAKDVLRKNFSGVPIYDDITKLDGNTLHGTIDLITGGDPCQPHSHAGLGKGEKDDRYLWPEMFRLIKEIGPAWVINENVVGSISNGILDRKIDDLERIGYSCRPFVIPAEAVGALHQRERVWLIANDASKRRQFLYKSTKSQVAGSPKEVRQTFEPVDLWDIDSDPDSERCEKQHHAHQSEALQKRISRYFGFGPDPHGDIPGDVIESAIIRSLNGLPKGMDYADRNKRIKALGNAIVPQVAVVIMEQIKSLYRR